MFCENCGAQMNPGAGFCKQCGTKISAAQEAEQRLAQTAASDSYNQIHEALVKNNRRKFKKILIIVTSSIVAFYAIGLTLTYVILPMFETKLPYYTSEEMAEMRARPIDLTQPGALAGELYLHQNVCRSQGGYGWSYEVTFKMEQISDTEYRSVSRKVNKTLESEVELPARGFQVDMITDTIHIKVTGELTAVLTYAGREDMPFELEFKRTWDGAMIEGSGEIDAVKRGGTFSWLRMVHE